MKLVLGAATMLALVAATTAVAQQPITDITIQILDDAGPAQVDGWEFSPVDLNTGVGGKYIYLGWKRGSGAPVTRLGFGAYSDSQQDNPWPDWQWNQSDLNRGAGGAYIYTFWQKDPGYQPIQNITFIVTPQSSPPTIPGYEPINIDLNKGSGGPYIFCYTSTNVNPGFRAEAKRAQKRSASGKVEGEPLEQNVEGGEKLSK